MEPKFQSSFIPKGPLATTGTATRVSRTAERSLLGTVAIFVFVLTVLATVGVFGYERYLTSNIGTMGGDLTAARASLEPETITSIARLDERIVATGQLLDRHTVLSPFFNYLESSTLKTVRFTEFRYQSTEKGLTLLMRGEARGYAAVALQAQIFNKSPYLKSPIFSDLDLDDKGNVTFSVTATVDPSIVSYKKLVNSVPAPVVEQPVTPAVVATTTAPVKPVTSTSTATTTKH